ncbi:hypothetical protein GGI09_001531 [Coemansia sp. S100]|nr:hypothetical protein LPJ71_002208 [Coemansia sp. S17]KAJ2101860.1 hypothetical protein GGI09_001531 [Coemansia sp. S100]
MPRPTRKATKPTAATTSTKPAAGQKRANATEEDELPVTSPTGKRRLRSQTTLVTETTPPQNKSSAAAADSGIEDDDDIKESPSKRLATDVGASPGRSPKVTTPRYGRRISSGVIGHPRRLTFGNNGRRTSGASDMVFDGLIDGFSPIKRNAPPETLDFDDEEDLPQAEDVLAGRKPSVADSPDEEEMEVAAADESDSELFDIDSLVARTHKPKPVGSGVSAARALASSSLGDTSVVDLLGKGSAGELLPRRTRTRSQAPKPEPAATPTKPARGRAALPRARKTATSKDQSSSSEEEEDVGDSWKPSKAATPARKPKKATATTTATTTVKRSTTAAAGGKRASARAKPNDSEQAASTAAWSVDPKTAKYFDDIDGFELTEEAV